MALILKKPTYVTQPNLPKLELLIPYLEKIWGSKVLTNGGPFHSELESLLCEYLGVKHISLFTNGTIALLTALQALEISGAVITTPFSFVATSHSLLWNNVSPIFVDIDSKTLNIDPSKIEAAITPITTAIMPVHCYGNSCDIEAIQSIAAKHKLKIIYDAAHAFGVEDHGGSILRHGDLSALSFHATKVFNTFEGGAIVSSTSEMKQRIDRLKNFGFVDEVTVETYGINGKMSELNAAIGILQLKDVDEAIKKRKTIDARYKKNLASIAGIKSVSADSNLKNNYSYYPILVDESYPVTRDELYLKLKQSNIYARRYFYPLISNMPMYQKYPSSIQSNLPIANSIANKILCLPIFPDLPLSDVDKICTQIGDIK